MRKLGVAPDWFVNSAHAVTEDGTIVIASNTGSQLAPLAFGASEVIFAIGSQKLVPDLETAFQRLEEHILPLESARMQGLYGIDSEIKKLLVIRKEFRPSRFTIVHQGAGRPGRAPRIAAALDGVQPQRRQAASTGRGLRSAVATPATIESPLATRASISS